MRFALGGDDKLVLQVDEGYRSCGLALVISAMSIRSRVPSAYATKSTNSLTRGCGECAHAGKGRRPQIRLRLMRDILYRRYALTAGVKPGAHQALGAVVRASGPHHKSSRPGRFRSRYE